VAIIRVGGNLGSGKTTLCKKLAEHLGYQYSYTGGIFREMAKERGLTIEEFYSQLVADPVLEKSVDDRQIALMMSKDNLVMEGRITAFLPCAFRPVNLFIKVDETTGASRQLNRPENHDRTIDEMIALSRKRVRDERDRYWNLYRIPNHLDERCYHLVIDSTDLYPEELLQEVICQIEDYLKKPA
jgi:predicted cytidylate kinase